MSYLKTILRYPGGKSRAIGQIAPMMPNDFSEYREAMVGGGSLYLYLKQNYFEDKKYWINDINEDLVLFWEYAKDSNQDLVMQTRKFVSMFPAGRELFNYLRDPNSEFTHLERAAKFFILNRTTFSGTTEAGGFSEAAWKGRMTESSIIRLSLIGEILENTRITNLSYVLCLEEDGDNVFIFLDPPYYSAIKSKLYGKNGCNHVSFNYEQLAVSLRNCSHKWLMTLDNCDYIRELFSFANIKEWDLQYGMNNVGKLSSDKGKELFIYNYNI